MTTKDVKLNGDIDKVMGFIYLYYIKMSKNIKLDYLFELLKENDKTFTVERLNFALKRISENKFVDFTKSIANGETNGILNWHIKEIKSAGVDYIEGIKKNKLTAPLINNLEIVLYKKISLI